MGTISKGKLGEDLYVIAEIGVNHGGDIELAKKLIDLAKKGGAHAAKFQSYKAHKIAAKDSPAYWDTSKEPTPSQYELFKKYDAFTVDEYNELATHCELRGIDFMSTPFDLEAVTFLDKIQNIFKIASADITNVPLLRKVAQLGKPIILSTGCSTLSEIQMATNELRTHGASEIVLLHCILNYPTIDENANLGMISSLQQNFPEFHIGYSDHTLPSNDMNILNTSYILGARVIEKHFTHDKALPGNDHYHSMDWVDLKRFISNTKQIDKVLGLTEKKPLESELNSIKYARRSLFYNRSIPAGSIIEGDDLICLRPGNGISPTEFDSIIGKTLCRNVKENDKLNLSDFK